MNIKDVFFDSYDIQFPFGAKPNEKVSASYKKTISFLQDTFTVPLNKYKDNKSMFDYLVNLYNWQLSMVRKQAIQEQVKLMDINQIQITYQNLNNRKYESIDDHDEALEYYTLYYDLVGAGQEQDEGITLYKTNVIGFLIKNKLDRNSLFLDKSKNL